MKKQLLYLTLLPFLLTNCSNSALQKALEKKDVFIKDSEPELKNASFNERDIWFNQKATSVYQLLDGEWYQVNKCNYDYELLKHSWREKKDIKKAAENALIRSVFSANCTYEQKRYSNELLFESVLELHSKNESYTKWNYYDDDTEPFLYWNKAQRSAYFIYDYNSVYEDEVLRVWLDKACPFFKLNIQFCFNFFLEKLDSSQINKNVLKINPFLYELSGKEAKFISYNFTFSDDWLYFKEMVVDYLTIEIAENETFDINRSIPNYAFDKSERVKVKLSNFGTTTIENINLEGERHTISLD